jgi:hypothetical protein
MARVRSPWRSRWCPSGSTHSEAALAVTADGDDAECAMARHRLQQVR